MKFGWLKKGALFVVLCASPLLVAIPASGGAESAKSADDSSARTPTFTATVLEKKDGSVTLQRESGAVEILSLDDSGISLRIGKGVEKGSRVRVTEERTGSTRTFTIEALPGA